MSDPFRFADDLGPAKVVEIYEPSCGLRAAVVVDNVACGPSIGGVRMAADATVEECFRLARAMTLKNAAAGLRHGGGKSVIFAASHMPRDEKERLIRAFAQAIADLTDYIPGPDMGTDETAMAWIHDEIGRSVGLPPELGGIPLDVLGATGWGLTAAIRVGAKAIGLNLEGARIAVQGFGSVGKHTARFLSQHGAVLVAAADSHATITNPAGLDVGALAAFKDEGKSFADYSGAKLESRETVVSADCDIWIPAARPDVIHAGNVNNVKAKLVAQGANIPVTAEAEQILHDRGILSIPDFIANAGGVICAAVEYAGGSQSAAFETIEEKITANTKAVLRTSREAGLLPRDAASELAAQRVRAAMAMRRRY